MEKIKHTISVKIGGYPDPTFVQLLDIENRLMQYLPSYYNLREGRVEGKYVYYNINFVPPTTATDIQEEKMYIQCLIAGMLLEKGVEII